VHPPIRPMPSIWSCLLIVGAAPLACGADAIVPAVPTPQAPLIKIEEGEWLLYKGNLQVQQRRQEESDSLNLALEVAYLGLGSHAARGDAASVLLLRRGESPDEGSAAATEAISLVADPARGLIADLPVHDRGLRVSPLLFKLMPLSIFPTKVDSYVPRTASAERPPRAKTPIHVLFPEEKELMLTWWASEADPETKSWVVTVSAQAGQNVSFVQNRVEIPFEISRLERSYRLAPSKIASRPELLSFESRLEGKLPGEEFKLHVELTRSEARRIEGPAWKLLQADARALQEIERTIFEKLDPKGARALVQAFEKERSGGRLARYAASLGDQADNVWDIVHERRLYGKTAPDFTLKDLDGKDVTLSKLLPGKITLLSFWGVG